MSTGGTALGGARRSGFRRPVFLQDRGLALRLAVVRVPANAAALAFTVAVLPGVHVTTARPAIAYLVLGAVFGLVNAFVKPALQFLVLPLLLASFGLVVVLVDVLTFWLLEVLFGKLDADGVLWLVAAGALLGLLSFVLDVLLGLTPPIVDAAHSERRAR